MVPHIQTGYHVSRPTLRVHSLVHFRVRTFTLYHATSDASTNTQADSDSGLLPFARRYWESQLISFSSGYLDVSVPWFASLIHVFS